MLLWLVCAAALFLALGLLRHPYLYQDVKYVLRRFSLKRRVKKYIQTKHFFTGRFSQVVKAQPHKPFVRFKDETFSFQDADELSNKAARAFLESGQVHRGDTVALFLGNEPMFLWLLLGLMKIGCPAALLNCNIRSRSLLHCFSCSGAKTLVAAEGKSRQHPP